MRWLGTFDAVEIAKVLVSGELDPRAKPKTRVADRHLHQQHTPFTLRSDL